MPLRLSGVGSTLPVIMDDERDLRPMWDRLLAGVAPWPLQLIFILVVIWLWMKFWVIVG